MTQNTPFWGQSIIHTLVLTKINLRNKFEMSNLTTNDIRAQKFKTGTHHALFGVGSIIPENLVKIGLIVSEISLLQAIVKKMK